MNASRVAVWIMVLVVTCSGDAVRLARADGTAPRVFVLPAPVPPSPQALKGCIKSKGDWVAWRDAAVASLLQPRVALEGAPGPFIDPDQVSAQSFAIANYLDDCLDAADSDTRPLLAHLALFASAQRNSLEIYHQFAHGPEVTDTEYLLRVKPIAQLPCLLQTQEFLKAISDIATYRDAQTMIDKHNEQPVAGCKPDGVPWLTLFYKSQFLGTPDAANTFGRFLVMVPGDPNSATGSYDKWVQFGVWTPDDTITADRSDNVSIVVVPSIQSPAADRFGVALDWWRVYGNDSRITLSTRKEVTGVTGNCQQCHKTSVIGIHPEWAYEFVGENRTLTRSSDKVAATKAFNDRIYEGGYFSPTQSTGDGDLYATPISDGPPMAPGIDRMVTKPGFMRACTAKYGLDDAAIARVSRKMGVCANCHTGESRGMVNFPMATQRTRWTKLDESHWPNLLYAYIKQGIMPPPYTISPASDLALAGPSEPEALFDCLSLEYHDPATGTGLLVDWFKSAPAALAGAGSPLDAKALADLTRMLARPRVISPSLTKQFFAPAGQVPTH